MAANSNNDNRAATDPALPDPGRNLRRAVSRTLLGLWAERFAQSFWPLFAVACIVFAGLWSGLALALPAAWLGWTAFGATVLLVGTAVHGIWRLRLPTRAEAIARLDASLPGRPLSALADNPAAGELGREEQRVWQAHLLRMANAAGRARGVPGNARLAERDPFALRHAALLAVALAVVFGGPDRVSGIGPMVAPFGPSGADAAPGPSWEGWIQPPAYTGEPSLYLNEVDSPTLRVPEGSRVTVRLYGTEGVLSLVETVSGGSGDMGLSPDASPAGIAAHGFEVARSGVLSIRGPGGREWEIAVRPDVPPTIRPEGGLQRERGGRMRQDFSARDDYGVTGGTVRIVLDLDAVDRRFGLAVDPDPRDDLVLSLPLPVSGSRTDFTEAIVEDMSRHPWAHMPVRLVLEAEDARGQMAAARTVSGTLPARRFFDPLAAALIELRRDLLWAVANGSRTAALIRSLRHRPDGFLTDEEVASELSAILAALEEGIAEGPLAPGTRDEIAEALWELALAVEEGDPANAEERLRRAQERLAEAMRQGADPDEIDELMQELREAMREALRERMRDQPPDVGDSPDQGERMEITGDMIQQMLDRIRELMDQGRTDEALALLEQLQQMLDNLEVTQGEGGEGGDGDNPLSGLGETLREQRDLADETFRDLQEQFGTQPGTGQGRDRAEPRAQPGQDPGGAQSEGTDDGADGSGDEGRGDEGRGEGAPDSLAERQRALRDALRDQQGRAIPGDGTEQGEATRRALDEAARAMEEAEERLRRGDAGGALDRQARAIEQLREGLRGMNEALMRRDGRGGEGEDGTETGDRTARLDPLGRALGPDGVTGVDDEMLPGEDVHRRARDILDEIRRRSAERDRPQAELDYLGRLLERF